MTKNTQKIDRIVERMYSEWRRAMLAYWVLGLLLLRPMYGLEIKEEIKRKTEGKFDLRPSTLYQMLMRMDKQGLLQKEWMRSTQGPPRAYYQTTPAGREVMRRYLTEVLTPGSPISNAMGEITAQMFAYFYGGSDDINRPGDPVSR